MEVQRSIGPQQSESNSMCESTQRSCEPRRKRMDERSAPSEMARIITDPITGKCYCRGKVLGKVAQAPNAKRAVDLPRKLKTKHVNSSFPLSREASLNATR